jgi:nitroreductase
VTVSELDAPALPAVMDVMEAIRGRRSVGKMRKELPPREAIETILEAGTWAPCHHVTEPWRFSVITGEAREALGEIMAKSKVDRKIRQGKPIEGEFERAKAKALRAPVIISVAVEPDQGPKVVEIEEVEAGAAAVQNMLLAAYALGLATMWRTGDPAYDPGVKAFLGVSHTAHIIGFIYVGYPEVAPLRARHTPHHAVTTWVGWDNDSADSSPGRRPSS